MNLDELFNKGWYEGGSWTKCFSPLIPFVRAFVQKKRQSFLENKDTLYQPPVPVIVVGNLTVGGTGKSPMVIALCDLLQSKGYSPGIVSRGYGSNNNSIMTVETTSTPEEVGDEPWMLAQRTSCPIVVGRDRVSAVKKLISEHSVDVIISDDGLQHYALNRHIEIVMVDHERGFGNGYLLPVGPLREPIERLEDVHFIASVIQEGQELSVPHFISRDVIQKFSQFPLKVVDLVNVKTKLTADLNILQTAEKCSVMAAIGNPMRFLRTLLSLGLKEGYSTRWLPDHHPILASDIPERGLVVMTEKDATKCFALDTPNDDVWYLRVKLQLTDDFKFNLINSLSNFAKVDLK